MKTTQAYRDRFKCRLARQLTQKFKLRGKPVVFLWCKGDKCWVMTMHENLRMLATHGKNMHEALNMLREAYNLTFK